MNTLTWILIAVGVSAIAIYLILSLRQMNKDMKKAYKDYVELKTAYMTKNKVTNYTIETYEVWKKLSKEEKQKYNPKNNGMTKHKEWHEEE